MMSPDEAIAHLRQIRVDFENFCAKCGRVSEADTRAKVIDRILTNVLDWRESAIKREPHVERGYIDYCLTVTGHKFVNVEAKREGIPFVFPIDSRHRSSKLSGALLSAPDIKTAVMQVRGYCDDAGIRYAIATNGFAWIVFRAIREDMPWKEGHAVVFSDINYIIENFTSFWNLLSYQAVSSGSLDAEFGAKLHKQRTLHRVVDILLNADLPLQRNRLHTQLHPIIKAIFEDIADQGQLEILKSCYVHSESLKIVAQDLDLAITDTIPAFLRNEGTLPLKQDETSAGEFGIMMTESVSSPRGQLYLLLGGIGSGKTTFLKRYQRTVGKELLDKETLWFSVNFLGPPDAKQMERFVWNTVLEQLRSRYKSPHLETRKNIKRAFAPDIAALEETQLRHVKEGTDEYERALSPYLREWQSDVPLYVPRLLSICKPRKEIKVVLFIDNVDQLSPAYQAQIFLLAQQVTRRIGCITLIALREESYYAASVQKTFTAYTTRKFHIASPRFLTLVRNRISYSLNLLNRPTEQMEMVVEDRRLVNKQDIADYLTIVESCLSQRSEVVVFIESLCFGNMRLALEMFTTFLASGVTDVDKMLRIYRREASYIVAYHEFVKSIMLGDRKFYKESYSPIMNVFDCGIEKNSSHFTAFRILSVFLHCRGQISPEGRGYFDIGQAASVFEDIFDDREDFVRTLNRLVHAQLLEVNTRSTENIAGASHARVTSSGWYYHKNLVNTFSYLDLVLQDTPLNSQHLARELRDSVVRVDNLNDLEHAKIERLHERFSRVEKFLNYLANEEEDEFKRYNLDKIDSIFSKRIVPTIRTHFVRQRDWIKRRVEENREKFVEESGFELSPEDQATLESLLNLDADCRDEAKVGADTPAQTTQ